MQTKSRAVFRSLKEFACSIGFADDVTVRICDVGLPDIGENRWSQRQRVVRHPN